MLLLRHQQMLPFVTVRALYPLLLIVSYKLRLSFLPRVKEVGDSWDCSILPKQFQILVVARVKRRYSQHFRSD